jgi:hypothetical protein
MAIDRKTIRALPGIGIGEALVPKRLEGGPLVTSRERKLGILYNLRPDLRSRMRLADIQGRVPTERILALIYAYKHGDERAADALAADF